MNTATKIIVSIGSIAVIATAGIGGLLLATSNTTTPTAATSSQTSTATSTTNTAIASTDTSTSNSTSSSTTSPSSTYKDGTYTESTSYSVPRGALNTISATVTVSNGTITAVTADNNYSDGESGMYIDSFNSSLSGAAVGASLASANFSRIGGASLTTQAFDDVLDMIRSKAAA